MENSTPFLQVTNGKVEFIGVLDGWREGTQWLRSLAAEGLLDVETFTHDFTTHSARFSVDTPIAGAGIQNQLSLDLMDQGYMAIPPLKGPKGHQYWPQNPESFSLTRNAAHISAKTKNPEIAVRWLDVFYDPMISMQNTYGPIGSHMTQQSNGTFSLVEPPAGMTWSAWQVTENFTAGPLYISDDLFSKISIPAGWTWTIKDKQDRLYWPHVSNEYFPLVFWTPQETTILSEITADIHNYFKNKTAIWVMEGGIEREWNDYINQLNRMGLPKLMEVYQAGYNRYYGKK